MFVRVAYPTEDEEVSILTRTTGAGEANIRQVLDASDMVAIQGLVREVEISEPLVKYIAAVVRATRPQESGLKPVQDYVRWGAGPRAGQALVLCAKARAVLNGHYAVTLEDIRSVAPSVMRHRLLVNFQAEADGVTTDDIVDRVFQEVAEPGSPIA